MDTVTIERRSAIMRLVRSKDTGVELKVRSLVYGMGYRYRLHSKDLPGKPDLVFAGRKKVIFVNGCFWHGHKLCKRARIPDANREYWVAKIARNAQRDQEHLIALRTLGWRSLVIWECELRDAAALLVKMKEFLDE
ncbi:MAG: very short patch repair endonuclease [Gallionella sp.]|jgi:DNA mismatch endonuclease (patch repair protein)